ncbi:replication initiation protein [Cetobacterium somerae]|uniref:replication initiation protein n=1 Tax=Cetobacterium somerae TaxID=188913 RepID=UPI0038917293
MSEQFELKHHKDFHGIQLQDFNVKDRNLVFALCYKLMEQEENLIRLDVKEIARIGNYKPTKSKDNIYKSLDEVYNRMKNASIRIKKENGIKHFVLFTSFETFEDTGIVEIEVNKNYRYLLNKVAAPFTIQNLLEYTKLNSGYSQLTYSLLRKWDKRKWVEMSVEAFRDEIGVPQSYDTSNFNRQVLKPIMDELPQYFKNLKLDKLKTGRKVTSLRFSWIGNNNEIKEVEKLELELSESLNRLFEKARRNRYLTEILTDKNMYKLTEMYEEDQLKKGLLYIYKQTKKEVPNFTYLIKALETGIQEQEIEIKIIPDKKTEKNQVSNNELESNNTSIENPLLIVFSNLPEGAKIGILESAKQLYLRDVNIKALTKEHEKFFKAAEKQYILKVLNGEK